MKKDSLEMLPFIIYKSLISKQRKGITKCVDTVSNITTTYKAQELVESYVCSNPERIRQALK